MATGAISRARLRAAWVVALAADCLEVAVLPFLGAASPADDVLDLLAAGALTALLGWHWAFLPSFLTKLIPAVDLVPTWTAAVYLATRGSRNPRKPAARGAEPIVIEAEVVRPALDARPALEGQRAGVASSPAERRGKE